MFIMIIQVRRDVLARVLQAFKFLCFVSKTNRAFEKRLLLISAKSVMTTAFRF